MRGKTLKKADILRMAKLCNCAGCDRELLGISCQALLEDLTPYQAATLPPLAATRVNGRPYCVGCEAKQAWLPQPEPSTPPPSTGVTRIQVG